MSSSCEALSANLKSCLLRTDCVLKKDLPPSTCLRGHFEELPAECQQLRKALFDCKRGMLDMRRRFRGNTAGNFGKDGMGEPDASSGGEVR